VEALKPDYADANLVNVVPALLGIRRVAWLPEVVEGAASVVLLVLDGVGWDAIASNPDVMPELAAMQGRAIATVVPSTTPAALTSLTTGLPPARHGITGFRMRVDHTVLNTIRWQQENGKRPPDPAAVQRNDVFGGRPLPVVTRSEFRTSGFTAVHLRDTDFHGWQTTAVLVEHVRVLVDRGAPFVYAYYPGVGEVAHSYGLAARYYTLELAAADRLVGAVLEVLPASAALVVTADHGQVDLGEDAWIGLGPVDDLVAAYAGDARFRYLHARDGAAADLLAAARDVAGAYAWVFSREQLLDEGWLGGDPTRSARQRIGDVVLAARDAVGFVDPTFPRETGLRSAHGSVTPVEMEVPLVGARGRA
jgi:predicted AlkP superfamily pyrophosphatase or phosphodiesterase